MLSSSQVIRRTRTPESIGRMPSLPYSWAKHGISISDAVGSAVGAGARGARGRQRQYRERSLVALTGGACKCS